MNCPKCGYCDEAHSATPRWVWLLRYIARNGPIFKGLLVEKRYLNDAELTHFLAKEWIELVPGRGFGITALGRRVAFRGEANEVRTAIAQAEAAQGEAG